MPEYHNHRFKVVNILCEGESEASYISKLQSYLESIEILDVRFVKKIIGSGDSASVKRAIKLERTKQRNSIIYILIDKDIYVRKPKNKELKGKNCVFLYNHLNFEDFLIMHFPEEIVLKWQSICLAHNHFREPLNANTYGKLLQGQNIISKYKKGELPEELQFNKETFDRLFENQKNKEIKFKSDFALFLEESIFAHRV